ncbi:hypothetical protein HK104_002832 [Borealophlyctis nickersoniae]|nr:hypothetical protein HK104_002832 [Borealophlyctis nickersoniae]
MEKRRNHLRQPASRIAVDRRVLKEDVEDVEFSNIDVPKELQHHTSRKRTKPIFLDVDLARSPIAANPTPPQTYENANAKQQKLTSLHSTAYSSPALLSTLSALLQREINSRGVVTQAKLRQCTTTTTVAADIQTKAQG